VRQAYIEPAKLVQTFTIALATKGPTVTQKKSKGTQVPSPGLPPANPYAETMQERSTGDDDIVETYASGYGRAFPEADLAAVEAHLEVGFTGIELTQTVNRYLASLQDGITSPRYSTLRLLYFAPKHQLAQGEIASELRTTPGNITQLVDGLQSEGLVERIPSPTSRRVTLARLTPKGVETAQRLVPEMLKLMESLSAELTHDEKVQLKSLLIKLRAGIKAAGERLSQGYVTK
jgi:DNA-binding MarR family transcriptional regulator